jgi:hypothetical protein
MASVMVLGMVMEMVLAMDKTSHSKQWRISREKIGDDTGYGHGYWSVCGSGDGDDDIYGSGSGSGHGFGSCYGSGDG